MRQRQYLVLLVRIMPTADADLYSWPAFYLLPLNHTSTPVEREKALTLGRRDEKIQEAQLGIEPRASGNAHQPGLSFDWCAGRVQWMYLPSQDQPFLVSLLNHV